MEIDASYLLDLDSLIDKVKKCGGEHVIVAGGAIRDMLLQKEIADIDVFYEGELQDNIVYSMWPNQVDSTGVSYPDGYTVTHNLMDSLFPVKVQLIKVNSVAMHLHTFPTPLSRVFYNEWSGINGISKNFLECVEAKELLFDKEVDIFYLTKLQEKFPEYTTKYSKPEFNPEAVETPF